MTYKLTAIKLEDITSPIIVFFPDGEQRQFADGSELAETVFAHKYLVNTVRVVKARNDCMIEISLTLPEVERAQTTNSSADSFF